MKEKVYVSSTYEDLKEYRATALSQLRKLGLQDTAMEHYAADDRRPLDRCLEDVRSCDLHVTLLAWRYGFVPEGQSQSITALEYREAGNHGIDRIVFLLRPEFPWSPQLMDMMSGENENGRRILDFREELSQTHVVSFFQTKEDLSSEIATAVSQWLSRRAAQAARPEAAAARDALRDYLQTQVSTDKDFETYYVKLGGTTQTTRTGALLGWPAAFLPAVFRVVDEPVEEVASSQKLEDLETGLLLHRRFVLLGAPGSGKTTTLRRLRLEAARTALADPTAPVPLLVSLPEWPASIADFASLLVHEREVQGLPLLNPNRLLLLADGLNEIEPESYEARAGQLKTWLERNPEVRIVIASRARHYWQHQQLPLPTVQVDPLNDTRISSLAAKFLGREGGEDLVAQLEEGLLHLARSPFLLSLLCYVYLERSRHLPRTRGDLLRTAIRCLYERELRLGNAAGVSYEELLEALGSLALGILQSRTATSVSLEWAKKRLPVGLDSDRLLRLATNADLLELSKSDRFLQFSHQLYLEQFAAEHLACHLGRIGTTLPPPTFENGDRVTRPFDEVIYALVGFGNANEIVAEIAARDPFLAAEALAYVDEAQVGLELVEADIARRLLQQLDHSDDDRRTAAVARLIRLGDVAVPGLRELLRSGGRLASRLAVSALGKLGTPDGLEGVARALLHRNRWVRRDAHKILSGLDEEERTQMRRFLTERLPALEENDRHQLSGALANCWKGQEPWLLEELCRISGLNPKDFASEDSEDTAAELPPEPVVEEEPAGLGAWGHVWAVQWQESPGDSGLERQGRRGLRGASPDDPAWGYVWHCLWDAHPDDEDLAQRGRDWLQAAPLRHRSWGYVWRTLWEAAPGDETLANTGRCWLKDAPLEHGSWGYVWLPLWEATPGDKELAATARYWLHNVDLEHASWGHVCHALMLRVPGDDALAHRAKGWLTIVPPQNGAWGYIWQGLWDRAQGDAELAQRARDWLSLVSPQHGAWGYVWKALWHVAPGDNELARRGTEWLVAAPPKHGSWGYVWLDLWKAAPKDKELARRGTEWLAVAPLNHGSWVYVWQALREAKPGDEELARTGRNWLRDAPLEHGSWGFLWRDLWKAFPNDLDLASHALRWLKQAKADQPAWHAIWRALFSPRSYSVEVVELIIGWLREVPLIQGAWGPVWASLAECNLLPPDLFQLGAEWLRRANLTSPAWGRIFRKVSQREVVEPPSDSSLVSSLSAFQEGSKEWLAHWENLWDSGSGRPTLVTAIHAFLAGTTESRRWPFIFGRLLQELGCAPDLMLCGRHWLQRNEPTSSGWAIVWAPVLETFPNERELLEPTWRWMTPSFWHRSSWPLVWETLWKHAPDERGRLAETAKAWLASQPVTRDAACRIWLTTWPVLAGDEALVQWAFAFLRDVPEHPNRGEIEAALTEVAGRNSLPEALRLHG